MPCFPLFISVQPEVEEWSSWDEEAPTSIKIEGGNGNVSPGANDIDEEPDYFKDMAPTIRKTQKVCDDHVFDARPKMAILATLNPFQMDSVGCHVHNKSDFRVFNADCGEEERAPELPGS